VRCSEGMEDDELQGPDHLPIVKELSLYYGALENRCRASILVLLSLRRKVCHNQPIVLVHVRLSVRLPRQLFPSLRFSDCMRAVFFPLRNVVQF
jgi:hypothetical protein